MIHCELILKFSLSQKAISWHLPVDSFLSNLDKISKSRTPVEPPPSFSLSRILAIQPMLRKEDIPRKLSDAGSLMGEPQPRCAAAAAASAAWVGRFAAAQIGWIESERDGGMGGGERGAVTQGERHAGPGQPVHRTAKAAIPVGKNHEIDN